MKLVGQKRRNYVKTEAIFKNQDWLKELNDFHFLAESREIGQQHYVKLRKGSIIE